MTLEKAKKVKQYFDEGYIILIEDSPYVDGKVKNIYEKMEN